MLLIRKTIICDNNKCGQGNNIAPKGPTVQQFAGITPDRIIWKHLASLGWHITFPEIGPVSAYCPHCSPKKRKKAK